MAVSRVVLDENGLTGKRSIAIVDDDTGQRVTLMPAALPHLISALQVTLGNIQRAQAKALDHERT